jgi:hypothetical protein
MPKVPILAHGGNQDLLTYLLTRQSAILLGVLSCALALFLDYPASFPHYVGTCLITALPLLYMCSMYISIDICVCVCASRKSHARETEPVWVILYTLVGTYLHTYRQRIIPYLGRLCRPKSI